MGGIEPTTLGLLDPRSDQLSYTSTLREEVVGRGIALTRQKFEPMTQNDPLWVIKFAMLQDPQNVSVLNAASRVAKFFVEKRRLRNIKKRVVL